MLYVKNELIDLSQEFIIFFVRKIRLLSQYKISEYVELTDKYKRRTMTRYEKGDRNSKDKVKEIIKLLKVNFNSLKKYNYKNYEDLNYLLYYYSKNK